MNPAVLAPLGVLWLWLVARTAPLIAVAPFNVLANLPGAARPALVLAVSLWLLWTVPAPLPLHPTLGLLAGGIATNLAVGLLTGLVALLGFAVFSIGGGYLDVVFGFTLSRTLAPSGSSVPLVQGLVQMLGAVLFLSVGGLTDLFAALALGLRRLPAGAHLSLTPAALAVGPRLFEVAVSTAAAVDAPLILAVLLVNLGAAAVGRLVPQLNVIALDFPVLMAVGIVLLIIALPVWLGVAGGALDQIGSGIATLDRALAG